MSTKNMTSGARPNLMDLFGTTDDELRSIMAEDLASVPDDELLEGFWDAYRVLGGFLEVAEVLSIPTFTVLNDAHTRTREALRRLEA